MRNLFLAMAVVAAALTSSSVFAEEHIVKGVVTQWKPMITFAQPGDTIKFMQMIGHDTEAIEGMIPEDAKGWHSSLGQEGFSITVEKEGAYVYKCNPHISTGMVGAIIVGDENPPANLQQIEASLENVKVAKNMVNRAIKKMKKALEAKAK